MSVGLYLYSSRGDLLTLLGVITVTRALIFVAMWWSSMRQEAAAS